MSKKELIFEITERDVNKLKEIRNAIGLSLEEVGRQTHLSKRTIINIEAGHKTTESCLLLLNLFYKHYMEINNLELVEVKVLKARKKGLE